MSSNIDNTTFSASRKLLAWGVHIFTASGVIVGLLALVAIVDRDWRAALLWLFIAVLIDTVDGTLARIVQVKQVLPDVDGRMLDYVIDFFNDVLLPTIFLYEAGLLPSSIRLVCCGAILLVSCYRDEPAKFSRDVRALARKPALSAVGRINFGRSEVVIT